MQNIKGLQKSLKQDSWLQVAEIMHELMKKHSKRQVTL